MNDLTLICSALHSTGGVGRVALHLDFITITIDPSPFSLHVVVRVGYGNFFGPARGSVRHLTISSTHNLSECSHNNVYCIWGAWSAILVSCLYLRKTGTENATK